MADWIHKEGHWQCDVHSKDSSYTDLNGVHDSRSAAYHRTMIDGTFIERSFIEWLNWHCEGGWEVFKISRDFQDGNGRTWCIFRKKTE